MKISLVVSACNNGRTCPNINTTDRGTVVIQGYSVERGSIPEFEIPACDALVEIPTDLLPAGFVSADTWIHATDRGTLLVAGRPVTDPEALVELQLPAGEDAVEVAAGPGRISSHAG